MMTNKSLMTVSTLAIVALLGGCASPVKLDKPANVETRTPGANAGGGSGASSQTGITPIDNTGKSSPINATNIDRVIYFDFDSYAIKDEFRPIIDAHAALLKGDSAKKEVAEGHTDERGGSEYNLALGQKRAEAVVKQMELLGAGDSQLEAVSYGKERPAVDGHDESAWAKNRRVELRSK
ncbi:MAG: peptidoglycan-associated lipoprotein Pal [Burkholderiaceae bacterium]